MVIDNFMYEQPIDNSHRNYCLNFVDPGQVAHRLQSLFTQCNYSELIKEIEINFPEVNPFFTQFLLTRSDILFRLLKYQLFDMITKDVNAAKHHYWSKMYKILRPVEVNFI